MGCGKSSINRSSAGAIIVSNHLEMSPANECDLASPFLEKISAKGHEIESSENRVDDPNLLGSITLANKKEGWTEISRIPHNEPENLKNYTLKLQSPTEILIRVDDINSVHEFNFDFLNESSGNSKNVKRIINDALVELESISYDKV